MKNRRHAGQDLRHGNKIILLEQERKEKRSTQPIPTNVIIGGALVLALLFFTRK